MASNSEFQPVGNQAWLQGYANLFHKENYLWWRTRRWWVQTLIWLVFSSGLLAMFIWVVPSGAMDSPGETPTPPEVKCLMFFVRISGLATAIGVTLLGQDTILNERQSGTMAWVLTKPVSRLAYILSKLFSHAFGILMTMVVFQGISVYLLTFLATGKALSLPLYAAMLGILFVNLLFFLTLSIMLSTISNGRGLAIGVPLIVIFGFIFAGLAPWLVDVMPWTLTSDVGAARPAIALSVVFGQPISTWMPVFATAVWCLIFTGIAVWRFQREEF
jgi:ABC-2 type transport system permease protein